MIIKNIIFERLEWLRFYLATILCPIFVSIRMILLREIVSLKGGGPRSPGWGPRPAAPPAAAVVLSARRPLVVALVTMLLMRLLLV